MQRRSKDTGFRQKAWELLYDRRWATIADLADAVGCKQSGLRAYIRGLKQADYVLLDSDGGLHLMKRTGPIAPSFNVNTGEFCDWNGGDVKVNQD